MNQVSLDDLLDQAEPIDSASAKLSETLRMTSWLSFVSFVLALWLYERLPSPEKVLSSKFMVILDNILAPMIQFEKQYHDIIIIVVDIAFIVTSILWVSTKWFDGGHLVFHYLLYGVSVVGSINALYMTLMATIVVVNLLLWSVGTIVTLTIAGLIIYGIVAWVT